MKMPDNLSDSIMKTGLGLFSGVVVTIGAYYFDGRLIPNISKVQKDFIAPNRLEITCQDLDENGELETIMSVNERKYLFREIDGKPVLSPYEVQVKPREVRINTYP